MAPNTTNNHQHQQPPTPALPPPAPKTTCREIRQGCIISSVPRAEGGLHQQPRPPPTATSNSNSNLRQPPTAKISTAVYTGLVARAEGAPVRHAARRRLRGRWSRVGQCDAIGIGYSTRAEGGELSTGVERGGPGQPAGGRPGRPKPPDVLGLLLLQRSTSDCDVSGHTLSLAFSAGGGGGAGGGAGAGAGAGGGRLARHHRIASGDGVKGAPPPREPPPTLAAATLGRVDSACAATPRPISVGDGGGAGEVQHKLWRRAQASAAGGGEAAAAGDSLHSLAVALGSGLEQPAEATDAELVPAGRRHPPGRPGRRERRPADRAAVVAHKPR